MESSLALPANIRLEWKSMEVGNTLAYYVLATITAVKSFIVQAPEVKEEIEKSLFDVVVGADLQSAWSKRRKGFKLLLLFSAVQTCR
jgi:hypothetical protein